MNKKKVIYGIAVLVVLALLYLLGGSKDGILTTFVQSEDSTQVIGFYNLENLFDTVDDPKIDDADFLPGGYYKWTEERYHEKLANMAEVIRAMKEANGKWHAILGVAEVENKGVLEDLVADPQIAEANYQIVHYDSPDGRGIDVGLLYDPSVFKLAESKKIPYTFKGTSIEVDLSEQEQRSFRTRDALMARGTIGGEDFAFYVMHLPSRRGDKAADLRSLGAEIVYKHAARLQEQYPGIKIVVMGDMNDDPFDDSMVKYLHGQETIAEVNPDDYFNPYLSMIKNGFGTLCYRDVWSIFDQELVNYNLAAAPDGGYRILPSCQDKYYGNTFNAPFLIQQSGKYKNYPFRTFSGSEFIGGYSDHFPTFIVIGR